MWWWSVVSSCWQSGPPRGVSLIYSSPSSAADTWTREPTRFIGPRTSRTVRLFVFPSCSSFWLHMQVIYLVLAKSVSAVFFLESQQEVDICKDWSETLSVDLSADSSIYPTYGVSQRHKRHQLVTEATKCEQKCHGNNLNDEQRSEASICHPALNHNTKWLNVIMSRRCDNK